MDLNQLAGGVTAAVLPQMPVTVQVSTGPGTTAPDGTRTPTYAAPITLFASVQPVTWRDLQMLDGLNLGGVRWKVYLHGEVDAVVRSERRGGDLITIPSGPHAGTWLVVQILEQFPDWCCAAVTLQNGG